MAKNSTIQQLEAMHAKLGASYMHADSVDQQIRARAGAFHDRANQRITKLTKRLERDYPNVTLRHARRYGQLLKHRRELSDVLQKVADRDRGAGPLV